MAYTQDGRLIAVYTPLPEDTLLLQGFSGREGISQLFDLDLELLSENAAIDAKKLIGQPLTIAVTLADDSTRYLNGFVSRFTQGETGTRLTRYRAEVVPWLWFLTRTADCRIFQNLAVPDIIEKVFNDLGFAVFKNNLQGSFEPHPYCVQYRETDFNFVSRLMEESGIFYFFEHEKTKHTLVLANSPSAHAPCPNQSTIRCELAGGALENEDVITAWHMQQELRPGRYALADFNFETPNTKLNVSVDSTINVGGNKSYEIFDYPGSYSKKPQGSDIAKIRIEEEEAAYLVVTGNSNCRALTSGYQFQLDGHYRRDANAAYVLTEIHHAASAGSAYATGPDSDGDEGYSNQFSCIPHTTPYRPARATPKPFVQGVQTAIVVGPPGEEIHTDNYGRVKVQFHWDREGQYNDKSSCWIRVAQGWAGKRWGGVFIPRIGQEVIVDFLEGDPDQPIIVGSVYNGQDMPPYALPDEKTKSTLKSYSSKGGDGFNEIRFEDKKGEEQFFVHGEKDMDLRIKNDRREWIGRDRHLIVSRDKVEEVDRDAQTLIKRDLVQQVTRDHHLTIQGKDSIKITGQLSVAVQGDVAEEFKGNHSEDVTGNYYVKGMNVVIEASVGLTIKAGSNFISLGPAGIAIVGSPMTMINSGGSPLTGTPGTLLSPLAPAAALIADNADPGSKEPSYQSQREALSPAESAAIDAPSHDPNTPENKQKKSWIEIELVDTDGEPVAGEKYRITLPDGSTLAEGTLDAKGRARVPGIDPGTCKVTFPNLDARSWKAKG